jgi:hypothetical protein
VRRTAGCEPEDRAMMVGHSAWHDGISLLSHLDEAANGRD